MNLGDSFPSSFRDDFSERNIVLGSVIKIFDTDAKKEKFLIIVGFDQNKIITATVRINSEINSNVFRNQELRNLCYHIKKSNYDFLDWDSVVDCSNILEWETAKLKRLMAENTSILRGVIELKEFDVIRSILALARTIEPKIRKRYGLE